MVIAVVDRGNGGPWEWRTPGMADPNLILHSAVLRNSRIQDWQNTKNRIKSRNEN